MRIWAVTALLFGATGLTLAVLSGVSQFPRGVIALACVALALVAGLFGLVHRGAVRVVGLGVGVAALGAALVVLGTRGGMLTILAVVAVLLAVAAANAAFRVRVVLPGAVRPRQPVLFYNPSSGGGKAQRFALAEEARARGIEPIELAPGNDLGELVRSAVSRGADALAMAGGDGSQAVVAEIAAEHSLPYACIPAGTRNHFALDLGVDRDDVVGALDALVDGGEQVIDLADVNGRVFVNNVSLGLYGEAVQRPGYRDAKLRTLLDTIPDAVGPGGRERPLRAGPTRTASPARGAQPYWSRTTATGLGRPVGLGTRPRLDEGVLGIVVLEEPAEPPARGATPWRQWSAPSFTVDAEEPVAAGIDGEAARLEPPLRFRTRPGALRVRIARGHPGASPSAIEPDGAWAGLRALAAIAVGRSPGNSSGDIRRFNSGFSGHAC